MTLTRASIRAKPARFSLDLAEGIRQVLRYVVFALAIASMFGGCPGPKHRPADLPGFTFTFNNETMALDTQADEHQADEHQTNERRADDAARYRLAEQQAIGFLTAALERVPPETLEQINKATLATLEEDASPERILPLVAEQITLARNAITVIVGLGVGTGLFDVMDPDDFAEHIPTILNQKSRSDAGGAHHA